MIIVYIVQYMGAPRTPAFNSLVTTTAVHSKRADYILYLTRLREDILNLVRASGKFGFMGWKTRHFD